MKKILMVGPVPPPYGGIASLIDDMIHSDLSRDHSFELFPRTEVYPPGTEGFLGRNLFRLKRFVRFFGKSLFGKFDLIHLHCADDILWGTTILLVLARLARARVILHIQGTDWGEFYDSVPSWRRFVTRRVLSLPTMIVVVYPLWKENIRKLGIKTEVKFIRNLILPRDLPNEADVEETRRSLDLEKGHFVVLMVGSVGKRKGVFDLLAAVPDVVSQDDSIRFVLAGGEELPGEMDQIRQIIQGRKIEGQVNVLGEVKREEVPRLLGLADVFILPSHTEGMPLAILEAMRCRVPVISTFVGGIPETIENEISGLLIHPGAPDEIARVVLRLKRDPDLRRRLSERAAEVFDERFAFACGIEEIRSLYRTLCADSRVTSGPRQ